MKLEELFSHYGYLMLLVGSLGEGMPIMLFGGFAAHRGWPTTSSNSRSERPNLSRLSPEKRAQIVEALRADPNASMIARHVGGVSSRTVQTIAEKAGIKAAYHW